MAIPRLHLFELEDQAWFPSVIRDLSTDYLHFVQTRLDLHRPAGRLLAKAMRATGSNHVIDLCSGGGGPVPALARMLIDEGVAATFTLTDQFPNLGAFTERAWEAPGQIRFEPLPVDARAASRMGSGFRTLFNGFHHFRPADALLVLRDAAEAGQPIAVFEISERSAQRIIPMLLLTPGMVLLATPFIRPFTWSRLIWTYLLPAVPLACWWDGVISQLRAYTPAEMESLTGAVGVEGYRWQVGQAPLEGAPGSITYLLGYPEAAG